MNRCYEIYLYANRILGNERAHLPPSQVTRGFDKIFPLVRGDHRITIVTNDENLGETAARQFADAILRGEYVIIHTELPQQKDFTSVNPKPQKIKRGGRR